MLLFCYPLLPTLHVIHSCNTFKLYKKLTSLFLDSCGVFCVCMAQSKFRISIYVLVSSKTIRCPSNSPFSSSTHIVKRHETCKDPAIRFKFFIQEPVGNKPWVCSQSVGILGNPGALKKTLLVKNSHAQLLHSPLQCQD